MRSVLANKQPLRSFAIEDDPNTCKMLPKKSASMLLSDNFWGKLEVLKQLLAPIARAIKLVEGNDAWLSSSIRILNNIVQEVQRVSLTTQFLLEEQQEFDSILKSRRQFCIKRLHTAANLLDPRYIGADLAPEENVSLYIEIQI